MVETIGTTCACEIGNKRRYWATRCDVPSFFNFVLLSNNIHSSWKYFERNMNFLKRFFPCYCCDGSVIHTLVVHNKCTHKSLFLFVHYIPVVSVKNPLTSVFCFVRPMTSMELVSVRIIAPDWKLNLLLVQIWSEVAGSGTVFARFEQNEENFCIKFYCSWHFLQFRCRSQYYGTVNSGDWSIGRTSL